MGYCCREKFRNDLNALKDGNGMVNSIFIFFCCNSISKKFEIKNNF